MRRKTHVWVVAHPDCNQDIGIGLTRDQALESIGATPWLLWQAHGWYVGCLTLTWTEPPKSKRAARKPPRRKR